MTISNKSWRSYFPHLRKLPEDDQYLYSDDTNSSIIAEEELHHSVDKSSNTDVTAETTAVERHPHNLIRNTRNHVSGTSFCILIILLKPRLKDGFFTS